jgi:hypothetical protein
MSIQYLEKLLAPFTAYKRSEWRRFSKVSFREQDFERFAIALKAKKVDTKGVNNQQLVECIANEGSLDRW